MQNVLNFYRKNTETIIVSICDYQFNTGDTIYFTVKIKPDSVQDDETAEIKANWTIGTDVEVGENGTVELPLTATQTNIDYGAYFYDLKIVSAGNGAENTLITGDVNILDVATLRA